MIKNKGLFRVLTVLLTLFGITSLSAHFIIYDGITVQVVLPPILYVFLTIFELVIFTLLLAFFFGSDDTRKTPKLIGFALLTYFVEYAVYYTFVMFDQLFTMPLSFTIIEGLIVALALVSAIATFVGKGRKVWVIIFALYMFGVQCISFYQFLGYDYFLYLDYGMYYYIVATICNFTSMFLISLVLVLFAVKYKNEKKPFKVYGNTLEEKISYLEDARIRELITAEEFVALSEGLMSETCDERCGECERADECDCEADDCCGECCNQGVCERSEETPCDSCDETPCDCCDESACDSECAVEETVDAVEDAVESVEADGESAE